MRVVRRHIAFWAAAWFLCQAAAISATPMAAYELSIASESEVPECCRNLKPGQVCPMHRHPHDARIDEHADQACHLAPACPPLDASLLSLATGFGLQFAPTASAVPTRHPEALDHAGPRPLSRAVHPDSPPPRT